VTVNPDLPDCSGGHHRQGVDQGQGSPLPNRRLSWRATRTCDDDRRRYGADDSGVDISFEGVTMDMSTVLEIVASSNPGMVRSNNEDAIAVANPCAGLPCWPMAWAATTPARWPAAWRRRCSLGTGSCRFLERRIPAATRVRTRGMGRRSSWLEWPVSMAPSTRRRQSQPQYAGMGTTLVVAVFHDNKVTVGHIGDSRMYRLRRRRTSSRSPATTRCCRSRWMPA
jgi:hypothetical protein